MTTTRAPLPCSCSSTRHGSGARAPSGASPSQTRRTAPHVNKHNFCFYSQLEALTNARPCFLSNSLGRSHEQSSMLERYREEDDFDDLDLEWSSEVAGGKNKGQAEEGVLRHLAVAEKELHADDAIFLEEMDFETIPDKGEKRAETQGEERGGRWSIQVVAYRCLRVVCVYVCVMWGWVIRCALASGG